MDRKILLAHLAFVEKVVAESQSHIEREEHMIADLERGGHGSDLKLARDVLEAYRRMQDQHVAHRNTLLKMLQEDSSSEPIFRAGHYEGGQQKA